MTAALQHAAEMHGRQSSLDPAGPAAARIDDLLVLMTVIGTIAFLIFLGALVYALVHRNRPADPPTPERDRRSTRWIVIAGAVVPTLVLVPVLLFTFHTLDALDPGARRPDLVVEVTGRQWWWDVRYHSADPGGAFVTANELHVPAGARVEVRLRSADVIHSFWLPPLHGKLDLIPGRENRFWIQADSAGVYRGQCAEYCGLQHARMAFVVVADPPERFAAWLAGQRLAAATPRDSAAEAGHALFTAKGCALCHAVRGTPAGGRAGPDLTHVASRRTLAAGVVPNTYGHMAGWIGDPQALKPGSRMPKVPLAPGELHAIVTYLRGLE